MSVMAVHAALPDVRGTYRQGADLSRTTWFGTGGRADVLYRPADEDDLVHFMTTRPAGLAVTVLGVGSNVLVRDHGIAGVTIRLGRGFTGIAVEGHEVHAGAATLDGHVARQAAAAGIAGLEFLAGVPGTLGGAIAMNAGAYGCEIADVLVRVRAVAPDGTVHDLNANDLGHGYRHCGLVGEWIFTSCVLRGEPGVKPAIEERIREIQDCRDLTQPTKERTGGSTFRNPPPPQARAWELIDRAGCRGLRRGGAMVSEKHCNFLVNTGGASATDLETLAEDVRRRVWTSQGVCLEWEIRCLGRLPGEAP